MAVWTLSGRTGWTGNKITCDGWLNLMKIIISNLMWSKNSCNFQHAMVSFQESTGKLVRNKATSDECLINVSRNQLSSIISILLNNSVIFVINATLCVKLSLLVISTENHIHLHYVEIPELSNKNSVKKKIDRQFLEIFLLDPLTRKDNKIVLCWGGY